MKRFAGILWLAVYAGTGMAGVAVETAAAEPAGPAAEAAPERCFLIGCYSGREVLIYSTTRRVLWRHKVSGVYDVAMRPNGNVLFSSYGGITEMVPDLASGQGGKVVWFYKRGSAPGYKGGTEVHSCEVQPDGNVITAEAGSRRLVELDANGKVVRTLPLQARGGVHHQFRLVRRTPRGTQLVACLGEGVVREVDADGNVQRRFSVRAAVEGKDSCAVYAAQESPAGTWLITAAGLCCVLEVDAEGAVIWRFDGPVGGQPLRWPAGCQWLPNGNRLVCDWKGRVFEVTPQKEVVWVLPGAISKGATSIVALTADLRPLAPAAATPPPAAAEAGAGRKEQ